MSSVDFSCIDASSNQKFYPLRLYESKAVVDPKRLVRMVTKPVRAIWIANESIQQTTPPSADCDPANFLTIVCCNPSIYVEGGKSQVQSLDSSSNDETASFSTTTTFKYTPGAADDDATWGRNLTPDLFWSNRERILDVTTEDEADAVIDSIVQGISHEDGHDDSHSHSNMDRIGQMNL